MQRYQSGRSITSLLAATVMATCACAGASAQAATLKAVPLETPVSAAIVEASPTFTWRPVKGAGSYEFQLSSDRLFGSINQTIKTLNTAATLKGTVTDGTYFWRVRAINPKNKVGRWSTVREVNKRWRTGPELFEPTADFGAVWPSLPLVMKWSAIPHATDYKVVVATDPSLAQPVLGSVAKPAVTQGTVAAFPGTLNTGTYYWQITPRDADGHSGTPSPVGRFTWTWPSALTVGVEDRNPAREVFDPLVIWNDLPGAAAYEVEVNTTAEFAPGSKVDGTTIIGTGWSPTKPLPNNTYYFRVRAIDPDGRAGGFAVGSFKKQFDDVAPDPTVTNIALSNGPTPATIGDELTDPMFTWNPVPGAASYRVMVANIADAPGALCDWTKGKVFGTQIDDNFTIVDVPYADLVAINTNGPDPGEGRDSLQQIHQMVNGQKYCMRVKAIDGAGRESEWAYFGGADNTVAFKYLTPTAVPPGACTALPQPTYMTPAPGSVNTRTPKFHWSAVPDAVGYWVVLSRNQALTNIVEIAYTDRTTWVPRDTITDETTGYYWAVWPTKVGGSCPARPADSSGYPRFDKASIPPAPQTPDAGATLATQPVFRWDGAEGAKDYRIQVARDAEFKDLIDNTVTASTVYASDETYPVDTQLYWRVRARDANGIELAYSPARAFRRTLPAPVVDAGNPTTGSTIPELSWQPVAGATSYGFHVDKVDGKGQDFTVTTSRFTPTEFYGNGIWRWRVRANFPGGGGEISGPYSESHEYVRRILAPENPRAVNASNRIVFSWNPDASGKKYKLQVAKDDSFTEVIETVTTPNTSYAPLLGRGYADGGRFYWRVAILDSGNNLGAYARGDLRRPPRLQLATKSKRLPRKIRTSVSITVTDPRGTKMVGARVSVSGAGTKGSKKTGRRGTVTLKIRPTKRGTVTIKASRKGYVTGSLTLRSY